MEAEIKKYIKQNQYLSKRFISERGKSGNKIHGVCRFCGVKLTEQNTFPDKYKRKYMMLQVMQESAY
jgi:hypothetical protein